MAKFVSHVLVGDNKYYSYKMAATTTDDDIGKPVKLSAADTVELCDDGDYIYGFVANVEPGTIDGVKLASIQVDGRIRVILDGNAAVGTTIEAAANTATGTAKAGAYGLVSIHVVDTTSAVTLAADLMEKQWKVISGTGLDEAVVLIEKQ